MCQPDDLQVLQELGRVIDGIVRLCRPRDGSAPIVLKKMPLRKMDPADLLQLASEGSMVSRYGRGAVLL